MTQQFVIIGGKSLNGVVRAGGSKNAAFPLLAASILCSTSLHLENIPDIEDIQCFQQILDALGMTLARSHDGSVVFDAGSLESTQVPLELGSKIRGSYYLLGALLARFGEATISLPGGCDIGSRPMDVHIEVLSQLGYSLTIDSDRGTVRGQRKRTAREAYDITLPFPSRGATINLLLAASLMEDKRVIIHNANTSPETVSLETFLRNRGVSILGHGTADLEVVGIGQLAGGEGAVMPDKIEVGTLLCAGLITQGCVSVEGVQSNDLQPFLNKLVEIGYEPEVSGSRVTVAHTRPLRPVSVISGLVSPAIDADWEPPLTSLLCTIHGESLVQDRINPERHLRFLPELEKFGTRIEALDDQTARIFGGTKLHGGAVVAREIRGGAALTLAGLAAEGSSYISNVQQIDRGYERLENKLRLLGADIARSTVN